MNSRQSSSHNHAASFDGTFGQNASQQEAYFVDPDMVGTIELATTNVIFRIAHASFMPAVGIGQAASTLVGKYIGQNREHKLNDLIFQTIYLSIMQVGWDNP